MKCYKKAKRKLNKEINKMLIIKINMDRIINKTNRMDNNNNNKYMMVKERRRRKRKEKLISSQHYNKIN